MKLLTDWEATRARLLRYDREALESAVIGLFEEAIPLEGLDPMPMRELLRDPMAEEFVRHAGFGEVNLHPYSPTVLIPRTRGLARNHNIALLVKGVMAQADFRHEAAQKVAAIGDRLAGVEVSDLPALRKLFAELIAQHCDWSFEDRWFEEAELVLRAVLGFCGLEGSEIPDVTALFDRHYESWVEPKDGATERLLDELEVAAIKTLFERMYPP